MTVGDLIKALSELDQTFSVVFCSDPAEADLYMEVGAISQVYIKPSGRIGGAFYEQSNSHKVGFTPALEVHA